MGRAILNLAPPSTIWSPGTAEKMDCYVTWGQPRVLSWKDHPGQWEKPQVEKTYALEQQSRSGKTSGKEQRKVVRIWKIFYHADSSIGFFAYPLDFEIHVYIFLMNSIIILNWLQDNFIESHFSFFLFVRVLLACRRLWGSRVRFPWSKPEVHTWGLWSGTCWL